LGLTHLFIYKPLPHQSLFVLARLLFPIHSHDEVVLDYKACNFANYRKFFIAVILTAISQDSKTSSSPRADFEDMRFNFLYWEC